MCKNKATKKKNMSCNPNLFCQLAMLEAVNRIQEDPKKTAERLVKPGLILCANHHQLSCPVPPLHATTQG